MGRRGEDRRGFILNYIETRQLEEGRRENVEWEEGRREKGMYSKFHPPSNLFVFCISFFEKSEEKREGISSKFHPPSNLVLFFVFFYSKNQRSKDETVRFLEALYFKSQTREREEGRSENVAWQAGRREKGMYSKFHPPRIFFVVCISLKSEEKREENLF